MASMLGGVLAANLDQAQLAPGEHPRTMRGQIPADDVGVHLQLRERRVGRRREVEQEDEQQRPCHRLARLTHAGRGEIAHQDVRQRGRAHHHAEDDAEEVQRAVVDERLDVRLEAGRRREPRPQHLLLARRDVRDRLSVGELGDRQPVLLGGQDDDRRQVGDDQHDVLGDLRPGHRPHAAQHRAQQDADEARKNGDLELHAEEARGDQARAVDLRRHISERAAHQHDHGQEAGEVAAEPERHEVGHRVGAELAQVRSDQDRHQHEAAGPAEHPGEAVVAEQEQRAGHADEGSRRHPVGARRHAVVEGRHAPAGDIILGHLRRARRHADDGVDGQREEHEQVAEDLVRHADLLENRKQNDEGEEAARVQAVHAAEVLDEVRPSGRLGSHGSILPQSSSATPCSRSILSCCLANMNSMTTNTIREPCAAM